MTALHSAEAAPSEAAINFGGALELAGRDARRLAVPVGRRAHIANDASTDDLCAEQAAPQHAQSKPGECKRGKGSSDMALLICNICDKGIARDADGNYSDWTWAAQRHTRCQDEKERPGTVVREAARSSLPDGIDSDKSATDEG